MSELSWLTAQKQQAANPAVGSGWAELSREGAPLFNAMVTFLAMEQRRAPLPVSRALWKGLLRRGYPNQLGDLDDLARRYLFLGDERTLLAELSNRPVSAR